MAQAFQSGNIEALPGAPEIDEQLIQNCSHIVAMMGHEPIVNLLKKQCDVILCGRASDTALFSALPLMRGFLPGPVWHCAKTIECGAICSTSTRADGVFAEIDDNGFSVEPLALDASCTPLSLASHTLYENADPYLIREPSGMLDTQNARYQKLSERKTRVEGSVFRPDRYTLKLEGATCTGFQTVAIGGVRDPYIIARVDSWLAEMKVFFAERLKELTGKTLGKEVRLDISQYGKNAVMGELEKVLPKFLTKSDSYSALLHQSRPWQMTLPDSLPILLHTGPFPNGMVSSAELLSLFLHRKSTGDQSIVSC